MFGHRYFGTRYFGPRYWGEGGSIPPTPPTPGRSGLGGDDVPRRSPHRGWSREEWKKRVKDGADAVEKTLQDTYDRLTGKEAPISVLAQVDAIVRPVARQARRDIALEIDWKKMARDYARAMALLRLEAEERELQAIMDDDDEVLLLL